MERGAGRYWTEDEVRALISIWSEKNIRKQLHGTLRNKGLFLYIAKRMQQLGVSRDWKQCRAKYKNLKYEYRAIKCGHAIEDDAKMRFYNELDSILGSEVIVKDENDLDSLEHMKHLDSAGTKELFVKQSPNHIKEDPLIIPPVSNEGGKHWTSREINALINIWSDRNICRQLKGTVRNQKIFEHIAKLLKEAGIDRDWRQCRTKYKNLKHEYVVVKKAQECGNDSKRMKYFCELDSILSSKPFGLKKALHSNLKQAPCAHSTSQIGSADVITKMLHHEEDLKVDAEEWHMSAQKHDLELQRTPAGNEVGKHWTTEETQALITIWSEESIRKQLEGVVRNRQIFEHIASLLQKQGIDRGWRQCRTKYKNLKHDYIVAKKAMDSGFKRKTTKFFHELHNILQSKCSEPSIQSETGDQQTSLMLNECANHEPLADDDIELPKESKEDDANIKQEVTITDKEDHMMLAIDYKIATSGKKRKAFLTESPVPDKVYISGPKWKNKSDVFASEFTVRADKHLPTRHLPNPGGGQRSVGIWEEDLKSSQPGLQYFSSQGPGCIAEMESYAELKLGKKLNEGKTKEVYELPEHPGCVLMKSKDLITAGDAVRKDHMEGKASISNKTTSCVFKLLQEAGIKTAFVRKCSDAAFIATHCEMIPIEWVCRRIATGSFLKRNPGVKEGYKFLPPKVETFFKDDANHDPQWSEEQLISAKLSCAGLVIGQAEVDIMTHSTAAIFEILEKAWMTQECTLVDMKIEFGVDVTKKEIVLADVIDNDSWRLWPAGDKSQQKDKQTYRELKEVTPEALQMVKRNFEWVADRVELLLKSNSQGRVVVLMGSISDLAHCEKIKKSCANYGIPCELRVTSAHKGPDETLRIKSEYDGDGIPTVFIAVAGRSNGLGPVMSGNTAYPVINCPPLTADWGAQDVWSSLRMPSGLGCSTVLSPEAAAQFAAQIFGLNNHLVWCKLRSCTLNTWISLKQADMKLRECSI
ncbi:multifunctional protein ADE2-like isoform X2 [Xenopus laevis]|uniref:Multifunctional protein ADE2-like isoform X2 n=2 Tax=Xenopus laevis TaxID=8355 RepID=A0A8J1KKW5_XENLA|nr:multifunctional protein ADE2-like isoform X2 [Xenopus laevis]